MISRIGQLYNKADLIELLVDRKSHDPKSDDKFQENPKYKENLKNNKKTQGKAISMSNISITSDNSVNKFPFFCPISNFEMNGTHKFVFGLRSKCIVSEKALRECNSVLFRNLPQTNSG